MKTSTSAWEKILREVGKIKLVKKDVWSDQQRIGQGNQEGYKVTAKILKRREPETRNLKI